MRFPVRCLILLFLASGSVYSQSPKDVARGVTWTAIDSLNTELPASVRVFHGVHTELPLQAWYVLVDPSDTSLSVDVIASDDPDDGKESVSDMALDTGACVTVNGGYFDMRTQPAVHVGLLQVDGNLKAPATGMVERDSSVYIVSRAALGITADHKIQLGWANMRSNVVRFRDTPIRNKPGEPTAIPDDREETDWVVEDALGAGPMILESGKVRPFVDDELFFGTSIPQVHPRTAAGTTRDGKLIMMVVDGRQDMSRGVSLEELAEMMKRVGARDALNLDGGGSSTLVIHGRMLNRPAGGLFQREVVSGIAVFCTI